MIFNRRCFFASLMIFAGLAVTINCIRNRKSKTVSSDVFDLAGKSTNMLVFTPKIFKEAPVRGSTQHSCSPDIPRARDWTGVLIRAPEIVEFRISDGSTETENLRAEIPLCGALKVVIPSEPDEIGMLIEVEDLQSRDRKRFVLEESSPADVRPIFEESYPPGYKHEPPSENQVKYEMEVKEYFNYNLADYLPLLDIELPKKYQVSVILREHRSNAVEVEVRPVPE